MKIELSFLRSKVAKRIFFLFVACALLPITVLSVITYLNMEHQLKQQSQQDLIQTSKTESMAIFERLLLIEAEMKMIVSNLNEIHHNKFPFSDPKSISSLSKKFKGIVMVTETGEIQNTFGRINAIPAIMSIVNKKTITDRTLILTQNLPENKSRIFMISLIKPKKSKTVVLIAEINSSYLWFFGYDDPLPEGVELSVMDHSKNVLFSSHPEGMKLSHIMSNQTQNKAMGLFDWASTENKYLAGYRSIFLLSQFDSPNWIIIVSKSKSSVFAALSNFKITFPPIILFTLWIVLLLSVSQIRRSMEPIVKLKAGTKRIAKKDFESRIEVSSRDEFEDVAESFNSMASQLGKQFKTLKAMVDIDRTILSALDTEKIIDAVLTRMSLIFPCNSVMVSLMEPNDKFSIRAYISTCNPHYENHRMHCQINNEEIQQLKNERETLIFSSDEEPPQYLAPLKELNLKSFLVLPLFIKEELSGIISLGYSEKTTLEEDDIDQSRQLADQVAVALSNANLINELSQFNWGTLTALARAIDAKSSWTAGHSERVTKISLQIGKALALSPHELEILHRGGLLHDIGKLGVSHDILDKPGRLSPEEKALMQNHVLLGAKILEPISAYKEIIPIVLEHHENYDGTGYPYGISGEDISLYARITAVADRFEAMTSNRPYRKALDHKSATKIIKERSGKEFDPRVIKAFLTAIA